MELVHIPYRCPLGNGQKQVSSRGGIGQTVGCISDTHSHKKAVSETPTEEKKNIKGKKKETPRDPSIHPLGTYSVQSVGAAKAVSLAIGHNPGRVTTPTHDTSKLALILPTSEG